MAASPIRDARLGVGDSLSDVESDEEDMSQEEQGLGQREQERSPKGRFLRFAELAASRSGRRVYASYDTVDGMEVAWKEISIRSMSKSDKGRLQEELAILAELRHPHVVAFHNLWRVGNDKVVYITDLFQSGSLGDFIGRARNIRWKAVKRWARQILRGLRYLHERPQPIIHRNLTCATIYINGASGSVVIAEFGLSTMRDEAHTGGVGTPGCMAPEQYGDDYDEKVDIFAFGMLVLEMLSGAPPYAECGDQAGEIHRRVLKGREPRAVSRVSEPRARGFIRACLRLTDRPSAADLQTHPFLRLNEALDDTVVVPLPEEASADPRTARRRPLSDRRSSGSLFLSAPDANAEGAIAQER